MSDLTITFGRVGTYIGSRSSRTFRRVPHEPPMYWAHRGEDRPLGQDLFHYGDTPWEALFSAIARERHPSIFERGLKE